MPWTPNKESLWDIYDSFHRNYAAAPIDYKGFLQALSETVGRLDTQLTQIIGGFSPDRTEASRVYLNPILDLDAVADIDLDRADLQVVIWEADDADMKKALRSGLDMHCVNACDVFDIKGIPYDELREDHPNYPEHRGRIGEAARGKAKAGVHATNYGVGDRKLAQTLGITVAEAARFRARWFAAHPGIRKWHLRTEEAATKRGYVENRFGARIYTFGRINLPELLGWLPQSTVAGVINRGLCAIDAAHQRGETSIELLIQVHDSLAGQFKTFRKAEEVENLKKLARVEVPYEEPLIIPVGVKLSEKSWGDAK